MNTEQLDQALSTFAKLATAPEDFKRGLAALIRQTELHINDLTVGDLIQLAAAHTLAYQSKKLETIAEHCLIHGKGSKSEQLVVIASILGERAAKSGIERHTLDSAVNIANIYLQQGYSGTSALMYGYRIMMDSVIPKQAI